MDRAAAHKTVSGFIVKPLTVAEQQDRQHAFRFCFFHACRTGGDQHIAEVQQFTEQAELLIPVQCNRFRSVEGPDNAARKQIFMEIEIAGEGFMQRLS